MSRPRAWKVDLDPSFEDHASISEGAAVGLLVGIEILRHYAGDLPSVTKNGRNIRRLASEKTYRLPDGLIVPPFAICYEISKDGTTAVIIGAREFEPQPEAIRMCSLDELTTDLVPDADV